MRKTLLGFIDKSNIKAGPIFVNADGSVLEKSYIQRKFTKIAKKANVDNMKIQLHSFRNLYLYNKLQEIEQTQEEFEDEYEEEQ